MIADDLDGLCLDLIEASRDPRVLAIVTHIAALAAQLQGPR
jgi:hypothetical protein